MFNYYLLLYRSHEPFKWPIHILLSGNQGICDSCQKTDELFLLPLDECLCYTCVRKHSGIVILARDVDDAKKQVEYIMNASGAKQQYFVQKD